jgi:hypothetical protein
VGQRPHKIETEAEIGEVRLLFSTFPRGLRRFAAFLSSVSICKIDRRKTVLFSFNKLLEQLLGVVAGEKKLRPGWLGVTHQ